MQVACHGVVTGTGAVMLAGTDDVASDDHTGAVAHVNAEVHTLDAVGFDQVPVAGDLDAGGFFSDLASAVSNRESAKLHIAALNGDDGAVPSAVDRGTLRRVHCQRPSD